jgi:hypothetical protein
MVKRTRAPTRPRSKQRPAYRKPRRMSGPIGVPITYTPELLANGRYRYERTDESLISIASDFGVHRNTFSALAVREGWARYKRPPRDLLPAAKLLAEANDLNDPPSAAAAAPIEENTELQQARSTENGPALPPPADTIMRLHRAVLEELGAVEAMRARLKREPQDPADAERTARTLSSLTETLQKLQRLQCTLPQTELKDDDDMPADIDEFRRELARRIRVFVEGRTERGHVEGAGTPPLASVRS